MDEILKRFSDEEGRIKVLPKKRDNRMQVYEYIASKFEKNCIYSESEVNLIISSWITFSDYFTVRRDLIDFRFLKRKNDGSAYWKSEEENK